MRQILIKLETKFWQTRRSNLHPSLWQHDYLYHLGLTSDLRRSFNLISQKTPHKTFTVLDVGCGDQPYFPIFAPASRHYIGTDLTPEGQLIAPAEILPFKSSRFDLTLSFQVLEHLADPQQAVSEIHRVLKPHGYALVSTHGIWNHHPFPRDYYRWTHQGLKYLFRNFSQVQVIPNLHTFATIIQLINIQFYSLACRYLILKLPFYISIALLNLFIRPFIKFGRSDLSANYLVIAKK